ncbi:hypothetical protein L0F63_004719 [Massospora cicadina]|nr:hypothetical protein L0F63_004719 [Massospora cicadina]
MQPYLPQPPLFESEYLVPQESPISNAHSSTPPHPNKPKPFPPLEFPTCFTDSTHWNPMMPPQPDPLLPMFGIQPSKRVFSFVSMSHTKAKKRHRRRYEEIDRVYKCRFPACSKSYGTLNNLNAHILMQGHGPKRSAFEFKDLNPRRPTNKDPN